MYLTLKNYFENLATQATFLNGFAGFFNRELISKINEYDSLRSPYLALFKYNINLQGSEQNTQALRQLGFAISFNNISAGDYDAQYAAIDMAEKLAIKVLARIKYDNNIRSSFLWNSLVKESVQIIPFELESGDFGAEVLFSLKNPQALVLEPDDWDDITSVCP